MKDIKWKRWGIGLLAVMLLAALGAFVWSDIQLKRVAGAFTEVVDRTQFRSPPQTVAIVDVNILSPDGSRMIAGQTVVLDGGKIVSVGDGADVRADVHTIDGSGLYLVPGLVDTHVHLRHSPNDLLLYLANGVTTITEMSGNEHHLAWREATEHGAAGPRMFIASRKLGNWGLFEGLFQAWTRHRINVGSADNAGGVVQSLASDGYDAVKLGSFVDAATYRAVNPEAGKAGLPVVGHLPLSVDLDALWTSGQSELAHIEELVKALNAEFGYFNSRNTDEFLAFVEERSDDVAEKLRTHGIAVSTTLWLIESIPHQKLALNALLRGVRLAYANPGMVEGTPLSPGWLVSNNPYRESGNGADSDVIRRYWTAYAKAHRIVLRALVAHGVHVMAGTDAGNAVVVPGFSLHDELKALVDAGMTAAQSLAAATAMPGEWLHARTGRIQPGYQADLLLLRDNPLDDIDTTRHIDTVIVGGRVFDRDRLDAMLAAVKAANDASRSAANRIRDGAGEASR